MRAARLDFASKIKAYPVYDLGFNFELRQSASAIPLVILFEDQSLVGRSLEIRSTLFADFQFRTLWQLLNWFR